MFTPLTTCTMSPDKIFSLANTVALAAWLLLLIAPKARVTRLLVQSGLIILFFGGVYMVVLGISFSQSGSAPDFGSLAGVKALFLNDYAVVAGWVHYLAFDLFVGTWQVEDAKKRGIRHYWLIPSLFFTFMLGPVGWLLYQIIRAAHARKVVTEQF